MILKTLIILTSISLALTPSLALADSQPQPTKAQIEQSKVLDGELSRALDKLTKIELKGEVSITDTHDKISKTIDDLTTSAIRNDPEMEHLNERHAHYLKTHQRVAAQLSNALNYGILTRGDMPSSEAGDVILEEKVKLKSKGSAQYVRQKQIDQLNLRVASAVMQVAMGLGSRDQVRGDAIVSTGLADLTKLVGKDDADRAVADLRQTAASLQIPDGVYEQAAWSVTDHQNRSNAVLQSAVNSDQTITEIKNLVHKYNHHSKLYRVSSRVMNVSLSVIGLSPTLAGPAAQVALLCYIMATGGPEEDKLMSELYLDKRLQSRFELLKDKTNLAIDQYQVALLTKNPMLLVCSQSLVKQMTTDDLANQAFAREFVGADATTQKKAGPAANPNAKTELVIPVENIVAKGATAPIGKN